VHCAFVAKTVEYLGTGLPVVSTPLRSAQRYFHDEPAIRFAGFDGRSFGEAILAWIAEPVKRRRALGLAAAARVARELDWSAISRRAVDFCEATVRR
jgi:glycosyltransferase involved in cell wall biosynthesis